MLVGLRGFGPDLLCWSCSDCSDSSVSTESERGVQLYVTSSGSGDNIGIYMFGKNRVSPQNKYRGASTS